MDWHLVSHHYPHVTQTVDWFHATEYIALIANAAITYEDRRQYWISQVCTDFWNGELRSVMRAYQWFSAHSLVGKPARKAVSYFTNNQHFMDYPTYRANGC